MTIEKYYVSTTDGIANNGIRRLTGYYKTQSEAEAFYNNVYHAYNVLLLRKLINNRIRKTIKSK